LSSTANWPEPWKYIQFPDAGLKIDTAEDGETLTLSCSRPIKGVILDVEDRSTDATDGEVKWSDQAIDLMPGDHQKVVAKGLKGRKVKARVSNGPAGRKEWESDAIFSYLVLGRRLCLEKKERKNQRTKFS
jgi:hypothetical protein